MKENKTNPYLVQLIRLSMFGIVGSLLAAFISCAWATNIVFQSGFESGFDEWQQQLCCSHSARIVESPVREGRRALQIQLHRNDPDIAGGKRAEIKLDRVEFGVLYVYRFSTFFPRSYTPDPSYEIFAQWHGRPDFDRGETWRSPPLSLVTRDGRFFLHRRWDGARVTSNNQPANEGGTETIELGTYPSDRWVDWEIRVRWSYQDEGVVEVWKDGRQVVARRGVNTYNDAVAPDFKLGLYKPQWKHKPERSRTTQRTLYFDRISIERRD